MTSGAKIAIGIALLAVVAAGAYSYKNGQYGPLENATTTQQGGSSGKKMAFGEFAKQGGNYMCTFGGNVQGVDATGTIYINGGLIRGEVTQSTQAAGSMTSSFIIREGNVYYWNTAMPQGIKIKYDITNYKAGDFDQFDQVGDYDCKDWTPDPTKFVVPTNIQFQAMN